jgi:3-methyladenine DNA glycosylase AlkD
MPTCTEVLDQLEGLGTEQNRKVYRRHGVQNDLFGVSYADLRKLHKKLKTDHDLAQQLWATNNHDARILATLIADPRQVDEALLDAWARDLGNYVVTDAFAAYVSKTRFVRPRMAAWTQTADEWIGSAGWNLLTYLAMHDEGLPDHFFEPYLAAIERDLHASPNRVRYAMNNALIAIGLRNARLEPQAVAVARRIGKVVVDHGATHCKTPDAIAYIQKVKDRNAGRS